MKTVWEVRVGDVLDRLREMPDESVHMVCTSPPYWGLRDYGTAAWDGGDPACGHKAPSRFDYPVNAGLGPTGVQTQASNAASASGATFRSVCGRCGARRVDQQLGLEATPDCGLWALSPALRELTGLASCGVCYVCRMVAVFREVRRVLRSDGTCWVNMGDGYANGGQGSVGSSSKSTLTTGSRNGAWAPGNEIQTVGREGGIPAGLKPKDLIGMPWRLAFALQADGWWLRSEIIWAKPNPMPESVTDRPTKAHEQIFLLTKRGTYFFDADAIREKIATVNWRAATGSNHNDAAVTLRNDGERHGGGQLGDPAGRNARSVWTIATQPFTARGLGGGSGGSGRTTSPDCPVHGDQRRSESTDSRDAPPVASPLAHSQHSDPHPEPAPVAAPVAIGPPDAPGSARDSLGSPLLECDRAATPRSNAGHRTVPEPSTTQPCIASAQTPESTARSGVTPDPVGSDDRIDASKTEGGSGEGGRGIDPSARMAGGIVRKCTCLIIDHFATFPEELPRRCILAGTSERGVCPACGAPWRRVVERTGGERYATGKSAEKNRVGLVTAFSGYSDGSSAPTFTTTGWEPTCAHGGEPPKRGSTVPQRTGGPKTNTPGIRNDTGHGRAGGFYPESPVTTGWDPECSHALEPVPAVVLDPFAGSGTTLMVAVRHGRSAIGIELSPTFAAMARRRILADHGAVEPANGHTPAEVRGVQGRLAL